MSRPNGSRRMTACRAVVILILLFAVMTRTASPQESEGSIRAHIEGLHSDRGQVVCALFAVANDFPKRIDQAFARMTAQIMSGSATCEFPRVPPGVYAVSVFHDENLNGRLDTNWLGIPREGVGASNNPKPRMGPPKFEAAEFQHSGASIDLEIIMHYL
jgi:uncharacterized protein (DUF2141 family)